MHFLQDLNLVNQGTKILLSSASLLNIEQCSTLECVGFHSNVAEISILLGCGAASLGDWCHMF